MAEAEADAVSLTSEVAAAYDKAAAAWEAGPMWAYDRFARVLTDASPVPLSGARALDVGAGTGAASRALSDAGARPVAVDVAFGMLRHDQGGRPPAAAGDAQALPFRDGAFDVVVAAFVLNHLPGPGVGLAEMRRVTRPGGAVLASVASARSGHPAKDTVERIASRFGYRRPRWYEQMKTRMEPLTDEPEALAALAAAGGLRDVRVDEVAVDLGHQTADDLVAWRLNTPALAQFMCSLDERRAGELLTEARAALEAAAQRWAPVLLILSGRA